ncbi:transporter substrate-binding domain-containing protein [Mesorhizobium sp. YC-39]|uniref:transporter substrate-binding domain-containing protein n=1 Tax=unclassified Mesorhizobium TaxID=325217 RepID=UPI0021E7F23C|nr:MULTISPECIES: transporter substrate-binding domain-containing protein [unclassified Mesorhizobium]MCV3206551.1 transporter substrate-binding domain-containing protein [Mesorhizobium sp. YC-2]MCV3227049.1 transporter substrate-binding domain-containing protein [Mesorhizobium sp. YC-39]
MPATPAEEDDFMLRKLLSIASAALIGGVMLAQTADARTLDQIIQAGTIRIGVNPNFPPMSSYGKTNEFEGFDIDVGNKIATALGVKAEFVPTETAQRVPYLVADQIDISLGALTRSAERAKLIDFTVPLHTESMAVLTTDKNTVEKWTDFNSDKYTLVNMRGNWSVDFLKEKLPNAKVLLVETNADTVRAVAQGRGDAIIENIDFFLAFTKSYADVKWRTLNDTIFVNYDSIGVSKGNDGLRQFLNVLLYDLHSSNYVNDTWQKWYGQPMLKPVVANPYF